jgi:hypothetical protein
MEQQAQIHSILGIDIGSVNTQATLIARVEGTFRFVARAQSSTTLEAPWSDVSIGARHVVEQLSQIAARPMLNESGNIITPEQDDGAGVDLCVISCSAAQPLHVVLAGLVNELSLDSMRRAAAGTYTWVEDVFGLLGTERLSDEARARRIMTIRPDVVCIAGGTDGGAEDPVLDLVEMVMLGASVLEPSQRPKIIFAGNANLRTRVGQIVGQETEVIMAESNVRPNLETENLEPLSTELEVLHAHDKIGSVPGIAACAGWSSLPMLSTAHSLGQVIQYLSLSGDTTRGALGVDAGAATTAIAASFKGDVHLSVRSDIGTAFGGARLLHEVGAANILRWLPFELTEGELEAFVINKELHPVSIPQDTRELLIEHAIARESIRATLRGARSSWPITDRRSQFEDLMPLIEPIIGAGAVLTRAPRSGQAALLLLDALEPIAVTTLMLDVYGLIPMLGLAALAQPLSVVQSIENNGLLMLGTVIVPVGRARVGDTILSLKISYESGGDLEVEVAAGTLEVLPLSLGQKASLRLSPKRGIDIGYGPGRGAKLPVNGGTVGLIIDARGRPLVLSANVEKRRENVQQWLWDMGS